MSLPVVNAPEVPESLTGTPGRPSGDWSMPKPLEKMNSEERQEWLRGSDPKEDKWSSSSLSGFEAPDAPVDEPKSDEGEKTVDGDVTTVSKGERKGDREGSEDAATVEPETERHERHTKAYTELPHRLTKEFAETYQEVAIAASRVPVSPPLAEFLQHCLADLDSSPKVFRHLTANPQLVHAFESMQPRNIVEILQTLDKKMGASAKVRVTKAPPPAREVGGRGSSSPDDENTAIRQGSFTAFRKAANAKALERSKSR